MQDSRSRTSSSLALIAAFLYAVSIPLSKLLLEGLGSSLLAGFLYLGAFLGGGLCCFLNKRSKRKIESRRIVKADIKYFVLMFLLDSAAAILTMLGLKTSSSSSVSLLSNFEIVATALVALIVFREKIGSYLWAGIAFITVGSAVLSIDIGESISFSWGSLYVVLATLCYGIENNCTRKLSDADPFIVVIIKGLGVSVFSISFGKGCVKEYKYSCNRSNVQPLAYKRSNIKKSSCLTLAAR